MKRYLLFGSESYYAHGGWQDFLGSFDTVEGAEKRAEHFMSAFSEFDWWHIVDTEDGLLVKGHSGSYSGSGGVGSGSWDRDDEPSHSTGYMQYLIELE